MKILTRYLAVVPVPIGLRAVVFLAVTAFFASCGDVRSNIDGSPAPGPVDSAPSCVPGGACDTGNPCERGEVQCTDDGALCTAVGPAPADIECRAVVGACDVAERCDGTSMACPADTVEAPGAACTEDGEVGICNGLDAECILGCSEGEPCNTGDACEVGVIDCSTGVPRCIASGVVEAGVECRPSAGPCDQAEVCDGMNTACPEDRFANSDSICRTPAGSCDVAETCTGISADCPVDEVAPVSTRCRASAGPCDIAEFCTGVSTECPGDELRPSSFECRGVAGPCDVAEFCSGTAAQCPGNGFRPPSFECRAQVGACDEAETCSGTNAQCPGDATAPAGTLCRPESGCRGAARCDGNNTICPLGPDLCGPCATCFSGDQCICDPGPGCPCP